MKQNGRFWIGVMCVMALIALLLAPAVHAAEKVTISGVVTEVKDARGEVKYVSIESDEGVFRIVKKGKGKELMKLVNKRAEVTGTVKGIYGQKCIIVSEYKIAEEEAIGN